VTGARSCTRLLGSLFGNLRLRLRERNRHQITPRGRAVSTTPR
jgi:hypothetical protein